MSDLTEGKRWQTRRPQFDSPEWVKLEGIGHRLHGFCNVFLSPLFLSHLFLTFKSSGEEGWENQNMVNSQLANFNIKLRFKPLSKHPNWPVPRTQMCTDTWLHLLSLFHPTNHEGEKKNLIAPRAFTKFTFYCFAWVSIEFDQLKVSDVTTTPWLRQGRNMHPWDQWLKRYKYASRNPLHKTAQISVRFQSKCSTLLHLTKFNKPQATKSPN